MKRPVTSEIPLSSDPRSAPLPSPPEEEPDEPLQVVFATENGQASPDATPQPEESPSNKPDAR
jgi:hypothetical protein